MKDNEIDESHTDQNKCMDLKFLIIAIFIFTSALVFSILSYDQSRLIQISMPRNIDGHPCPPSHPYLQFNGTNIAHRHCVTICDDAQPSAKLGGVCISQRVKFILTANGDYSQYIQSHQMTIHKLYLIFKAIAITALIALILGLLTLFQTTAAPNNNTIKILILITLITMSFALYYLFPNPFLGFHDSLSISWIILLKIFVLFCLYMVIWWLCNRGIPSAETTQIFNEQAYLNDNTATTKIFVTILVFIMVSILQTILFLLEYLAIRSSSSSQWQFPQVFETVDGFSYKQALLILQVIYSGFFTHCAYQYFVSSIFSTSYNNRLSHRSFFFIGSIAKMAFLRMLLSPFIFLLTLMRPMEGQNSTECCYCLCGYALNKAHQYSLPVLAYQSAMKNTMPLSVAAKRIHFEWHINRVQFNQAYFYKMSIICLLIAISAVVLKFLSEVDGININGVTLLVTIFVAHWVGYYPASVVLHEMEGKITRKICEANRQQIINSY